MRGSRGVGEAFFFSPETQITWFLMTHLQREHCTALALAFTVCTGLLGEIVEFFMYARSSAIWYHTAKFSLRLVPGMHVVVVKPHECT